MTDVKRGPTIEWSRRYRNAAGGPINQIIDYVEYTRFEDGATTFLAHKVDGNIPKEQGHWTFRNAEQLVASGNWISETFNPAEADKPETTGDEVAW